MTYEEAKGLSMKTCGQCNHFLGMGDWNLCCDIEHPTPKEKEQGLDFPFGHLCYENSEACDAFEEDNNEKKNM